MPKSTLSNPRGVRGAASLCAVAALAYLFVQDLLTIFVSALMGMRVQGASLSNPVGFSVAAQGLLGIMVAAGSIVLPLWWLLRATRLQTQDLRILLPAPWSPAFCLVVFLGLIVFVYLMGVLIGYARQAAGEKASRRWMALGAAALVALLFLCKYLTFLLDTLSLSSRQVCPSSSLNPSPIWWISAGAWPRPAVR